MAVSSSIGLFPSPSRMTFMGMVLLVFVTACGAIAPKTVKSSEYRYHFSECGPDVRQFSSKRDYCDALRNEALNQGCAAELRRRQYEIDCA